MIETIADLIRRPLYLEKIKPYIGVHIIKVFTGQRRVGKSYILQDTKNYIEETNPDANCIYLSTETGDGKSVKDAEDLYSCIQSKLNTGKDNFVFIDEIQEIRNFESAVKSLFAEQNCDIYCTGSNAHLLSGELATYLAGRYIQIRIHPLSYQEFLQFYKKENTAETCLFFLQRGGMPFLYSLPPEESFASEYLRNVSESILFRDVIAREKIRNVHFLENLVSYIADNTGSLFSASNISRYLKNQKINMNVQSVITYLYALKQSFIINAVPRKDIRGMKIFEIGEKYYFEDTGLRNVNAKNSFYDDSAKILENAVYNHLIQQEFEVYVGQSGTQEIDFAAQKGEMKIYVQVSQTIADRRTFERETDVLLKIQDNFPKYIVTLDPLISSPVPQGIHCMNAKDFFMMKW
jgi:uncharacterized protein